MIEEHEKVAKEIYKVLAGFGSIEADVLLAGVAVVLCRLSLAVNLDEESSVNVYRQTFEAERQNLENMREALDKKRLH